ncbi:MAG TPA: sigma-70 family RNA polymerase sigma factor [Rariglobus sp.]|jgi:RNA polymerase sigma-70 factor (ECF subfamily)|nr:sigma-70 family RNA polymerase sigma factor [Rariglobus sp.]
MSTKAQEVALDRLLVDRFKNGDEAAFNEMVSRYWDRIYGMVHQLLRNQQDAEEVTQDAFIRAHRGLVNFRGDSAFSTWLYQIATNLARNRYWYWWRRKRDKTVSFDQPVSDDNDTPLSEVFAAEVETPGDITVTHEFVDRIAAGMDKLSPKHREILILRNVKNMAYEEISGILGISVGTVKSRIARARESLRATMGEDFK